MALREGSDAMPLFTVRVEMAVGLDLDLEIEASDREAAAELASEAATEAAPLWALTQRFNAFKPTFVDGDVVISDIAVRSAGAQP